MILTIHSDASYLSESQARSRARVIFYFSSKHDPATPAPTNGAVHITSVIIKHVMSSTAEAELVALFYIAQDACSIRVTLEQLGHPQPPSAIQTDNECAKGIANDTVKQRRSRAMDMRFYWIRDWIEQGQFIVHWKPGKNNHTGYFTKHHRPHHQALRYTYLQGNLLSYDLVRVCYKCTPRSLTLFSVLQYIFLPKSQRLHEKALNHSQ
jgi:hypothetical protein